MQCIFMLRTPGAALASVDWPQVDINFVSCDGQLRAWPPLLTAAKHLHACAPKIQKAFIATLLEYTGPQQPPAVQPEGSSSSSTLASAASASAVASWEPADADDLLQHFALELTSPGSTYTKYQLLPEHERGFNLDRRDRQGRTLLTTHALQCGNNGSRDSLNVEPAVSLLLKLGATPLQTNADGATLFDVWTKAGRADLLEAALMDSAPLQGLQVYAQMVRWVNDAGAGKSVAQLLGPAAATATPLLQAMLLELQQFWKTHTRPLLMHRLTEHKALIPVVAQIVLSYVDGLERA